MPLLANFDKTFFLQECWQQKPLFVAQCFSELNDIFHGDDLAGLACDEQAESRIITGFGLNNDWTCQQGPFNEGQFAKLPENNWTLLVQGLDQWSDDCRAILDDFDFLPRWRLEDIMASVAPMGGGVGPHFDYYDVFLIQVSGMREWQLGQDCDEQTPLQDNPQVKLLTQFDTTSIFKAAPGDMLYIPAGVAHWGTALTDDCITLSVGFRAPSEKEIMAGVLENVVEQLSEYCRYQDTQHSIDADPYKINNAAYENIKTIANKLTPAVLEQAMLESFGCLVTEPRYSGFDESDIVWTQTMLTQWFAKQGCLQFQHATHARLAFTETHLFVNGESYPVGARFSRQLCELTVYATADTAELAILCYLLNESLIELDE